jgi:hypothetical protein
MLTVLNLPRSPQTAPAPPRILQRFQRQQNIEIDLVPFKQFVVGEAFETLAFLAFVAILGMKALDELVQI